MSFHNGDKSRENRLRKQREKKREKIREMKSGETKKAAAKK